LSPVLTDYSSGGDEMPSYLYIIVEAYIYYVEALQIVLVKLSRSRYLPNSFLRKKPPTFLSSPVFDVGIPVVRETFCFSLVMPRALFREKERPGMGVERLFPIVVDFIWLLCSSAALSFVAERRLQQCSN
jgi:hypothetical protein